MVVKLTHHAGVTYLPNGYREGGERGGEREKNIWRERDRERKRRRMSMYRIW